MDVDIFAMFFLLLSEIIQDAHKVGLKLTHFLFGESAGGDAQETAEEMAFSY